MVQEVWPPAVDRLSVLRVLPKQDVLHIASLLEGKDQFGQPVREGFATRAPWVVLLKASAAAMCFGCDDIPRNW